MVEAEKIEELKQLFREGGYVVWKVIDKILKIYESPEFIPITISLEDITDFGDQRRVARKAFTRLGFKVAFDNVYVETKEQVKNLLNALIDMGIVKYEDRKIVFVWPFVSTPDLSPLEYENLPEVVRALYAFPDVLERLGLTRFDVLNLTLEIWKLNQKILADAGFKLEKENEWSLEYVKYDEDEFRIGVVVTPGKTKASVEKKFEFPLVGSMTLSSSIFPLNEGETFEDAISHRKTEIMEFASKSKVALEELARLSEELGVEFNDLDVSMEDRVITGEWKKGNMPTTEFSVSPENPEEVRSLVNLIRTAITSKYDLSVEAKRKILDFLFSGYFVSVLKIVEATGVGYWDIVRYAKSLGAEYKKGEVYLDDEKKVQVAERAVDEGVITPQEAANLLDRIFSQKVYEALKAKDRMKAAIYRVRAGGFDDAIDEIQSVYRETKSVLNLISLLKTFKDFYSLSDDEYKDRLDNITAEALSELTEDHFRVLGTNLKYLIDGKKSAEIYGEKLGEFSKLGPPTHVFGAKAEWDMGDIVVFIEPPKEESKEKTWRYGAVSKKNRSVVVEKRSRGVPHIYEGVLSWLKEAILYGEEVAEFRQKLYLKAIYDIAEEYAKRIGQEPSVDVRKEKDGVTVIIPGVGVYKIHPPAFGYNDDRPEAELIDFEDFERFYFPPTSKKWFMTPLELKKDLSERMLGLLESVETEDKEKVSRSLA